MKDSRILKMVQMTILIAVVLLMSFTPLGYLKTVGLEISLLTIPVVVGSMVLGPAAGGVLGAVFGLTSFWRCFGMDAFGTVLLNINPFLTFLVCVPTRVLTGILTGLLFRAAYRLDKTRTVSYFAGGLTGALLNTLLFMGTLMLGFWHTEYIQEINDGLGGLGAIGFLLAFVGLNGLVEAVACCLAGGAISKAVSKSLNHI